MSNQSFTFSASTTRATMAITISGSTYDGVTYEFASDAHHMAGRDAGKHWVSLVSLWQCDVHVEELTAMAIRMYPGCRVEFYRAFVHACHDALDSAYCAKMDI